MKKKLQYANDLAPLFAETMSMPQVTAPTDPGGTPTEMTKLIWKEEVKTYVSRNRALQDNMTAIHAVVWGQCSEAMKAKVKAHKDYNNKARENDCHWLLKQIKAVTLQFDETRNGFLSLLDALANFVNWRQKEGQTVDDYVDALRGFADTIEYHGGTVVSNPTLVPETDADGALRTIQVRTIIARDRTLAMALILSNQYAMGKDEHPTNLNAAYSLLVNYETPANARVTRGTATATAVPSIAPEASSMTFAQQRRHSWNQRRRA